jgi:hypothetical protein
VDFFWSIHPAWEISAGFPRGHGTGKMDRIPSLREKPGKEMKTRKKTTKQQQGRTERQQLCHRNFSHTLLS